MTKRAADFGCRRARQFAARQASRGRLTSTGRLSSAYFTLPSSRVWCFTGNRG